MIENVLIVSAVALCVNIFLGRWRARYRKFAVAWWVLIHASIPIIVPLRIWLDTPKMFIPLFIALGVLGQFLGNRCVLCKVFSKRG